MHLHRSNRTEKLLEALVAVVERPLSHVFEPECIVVQGPGMERWLSLELSQRLSVWGNAKFPFPRALFEEAMNAALGPRDEAAVDFEPETLVWSIAALLPEMVLPERVSPGMVRDEAFTPIRGYLARDLDGDDDSGASGRKAGGDRLLQLAERIARVFDSYGVHRPELLWAWEEEDDAAALRWGEGAFGWQAKLWRALVARHGADHFASRMRGLIRHLESATERPAGFPERICVFGISSLPPLYLAGLAALARQVEVHVFLLSPSREYWAEIRSERERLRAEQRAALGGPLGSQDLHWSPGHPLLASLGRLGRDFQQILEGMVDYQETDHDLYVDPGSGEGGGEGAGEGAGEGQSEGQSAPAPKLLQCLQSDILHLRRRGEGEGGAETLTLAKDDDSIRVHACHGPMREAEVLRDQLLDIFDRHPDLQPRDVVVMTPDIETYAPYLEAVFRTAGAGSGGPAGEGFAQISIPCRIADRSARQLHPAVEAFSKSLALLGGRMKASDVLDVLSLECVRERFGIRARDEAILKEWVLGSGIRWGVDAEQRRDLDQPAVSANTWRFGLDRLLLGRALGDAPSGPNAGPNAEAGEGALLFGEVLPYGEVEGDRVELLGQLAEFCETLFALSARAQRDLTPSAWHALLGDLVERMLAVNDDNVHEHILIREALDDLRDRSERAGYGGRFGLTALRAHLDRFFVRRTHSSNFLSGGVTFCEMVPMRSIPFRVVCLLGMGDESFPRIQRPLGFDLMARHRLPGDRSSREDDRYLFLEAILSARDHLLVSYVGQDIRDNAKLPPSVVVGELLDCLGDGHRVEGEAASASREAAQQSMRARLVIHHPLQPFSPRYFENKSENKSEAPSENEKEEDDEPLFSFSAHYRAGAEALLSGLSSGGSGGGQGDGSHEASGEGRFVSSPLPVPELRDPTALAEVSVDELIQFFRNPARAFMQGRLGLRLGGAEDEIANREPLGLEGLAEWQLGEALLARALRGDSVGDALEAIRAEGVLPLGMPGRCMYADLVRTVEDLARQVCGLRGDERLPDQAVDHVIAGTRVHGRLEDLWGAGQLRHQYSKLGNPAELDSWLLHLLLNHVVMNNDVLNNDVMNQVAPNGHPRVTHLVGRARSGQAESVSFEAVDEPETLLEDLLRIYHLGQTTPLPFFPRTSRSYIESFEKAKSREPEEAASLNAYEAYRGSERQRGDGQEPYIRQAFRDFDPLASSFVPRDEAGGAAGFRALARRVFDPMLAKRTGGR